MIQINLNILCQVNGVVAIAPQFKKRLPAISVIAFHILVFGLYTKKTDKRFQYCLGWVKLNQYHDLLNMSSTNL